MRKITALLVAILPLLMACNPPATTTTTTTTAQANPNRYVFGDSLGAQVVSTGITKGDGFIWQVNSGWSLMDWESAVLEAAATRPKTIVLALGSNEALKYDGWSSTVSATWTRVVRAVHPDTELVFVLPHFEPQIEGQWPGAMDRVESVRQGMLGLASYADAVRDWRPPVQANPGWIGDGVHLYAMGGSAYIDDPAFVGRYRTVVG